MALTSYLKHNLRSAPDAAPNWRGVQLLLDTEPSRLKEATLSDLLFLIDYFFRLCADVQDTDEPLPDEATGALKDLLTECGYNSTSACQASASQSLVALVSHLQLFVDWIFAYHSSQGTSPGRGSGSYETELFLSEEAHALVTGDVVSADDVYSTFNSVLSFAHAHVDLLSVDILTCHAPEQLRGDQAAKVLRLMGSALARIFDQSPQLLGVLPPSFSSKLDQISNFVADSYADDMADQIYNRGGADLFGKDLILIDPSTVISVEVIESASTIVEQLHSADFNPTILTNTAERFTTLLTQNRSFSSGTSGPDWHRVSNFVTPEPTDKWPSSLPEVESLLREVALVFVLANDVVRPQVTGEPGDWSLYSVDDLVISIRLPTTNLASPKMSPWKRRAWGNALQAHPLLTWLIMPSTLQDPADVAMFSDGAFGKVGDSIHRIASDEERRRRLESVKSETQEAAAGAVGTGMTGALLAATLPQLPDAAIGAVGGLIGHLFQHWLILTRRDE